MSGRGKKAIFHRDYSYSRHDDTVLVNARIDVGIRYDGWRLQAAMLHSKLQPKRCR